MKKIVSAWIGILANNQETLEKGLDRIKNKKSRKCVLINLNSMNGPIDISNHYSQIDEIILIGEAYQDLIPYWIAKLQIQCNDNDIDIFVKKPVELI